MGTVPPSVPQRVILTKAEDVETIWSPGDCGRESFENAAERFPAAPVSAVPPSMPKSTIIAVGEDLNAVRSPPDGHRRRRDNAAEPFPRRPMGGGIEQGKGLSLVRPLGWPAGKWVCRSALNCANPSVAPVNLV